ncbi:Potassium efflux system KefA protein / Small-conductance mechanosensitive channel [Klebsiella pneumoniae]|uniref:Potassium efflux system KefA protein / Small-conductance mechanosensitive channel n=1 Tax=Klebsiella pneumoniae TaxID=573 RepID=A0A377TR23_KLEPN|nr:Potassium efflux system KefA protein / Small-conductance mechanosensitive channel [Klebsiella pneumoniae]
MRGIGSVVANYDVDRHEDLDKASQALKAAVDDLLAQEEIRGLIIGEPSFAGLVGLSNTAFTLRVSFTTLPLKQWTVRFALDTQVKKHFDAPGFARRYRPGSSCRCRAPTARPPSSVRMDDGVWRRP